MALKFKAPKLLGALFFCSLTLTFPAFGALFAMKTAEIHVLSLNVWGLPAPLGTDLKPRMERIARAIQDYDIVLLQETFDKSTDAIGLEARFQHWYQQHNPGWGKIRSGLTTLSRWPILKTGFKPFKRCILPDCLARKGVLFTRIQHPELGPIDVYNTHYQSMQKPEAQRVRREDQNAVLAEFVFENNQYYPTLMGGDFNLYPDLEEYQDLMKRLPAMDSFREIHPEHSGFTVHHDANPQAKMRSQRIDYIFVLKNELISAQVLDSQLRFTEPVAGYMLSDHFGVSSRIRLSTPQLSD
ncbi:hypothetical protein COW36_12600 [bacterium (Candidatus Blackallbacteria) CG17_big_fil_post_rev_8_21_14_2_50_48_46]|uniref:Endonuclease/exonuclease/phosphatase domain-containing protein n=1 Tax=bacterium (Candidatus Blackallbacteria) CG17_big_fil_post_rev_8_21_14_2_50_48_46 TaxID=2014261 RepID=A0A2M7G4C6_9BACT|nr:MAG: hypothetical protein COW64_02660 [bacterium (Candidatus Blackallbacteria) CG18_big_fil_WC_8_21_14_2_50_49_26]PIW16601.1 MAG: hypothetical protein COW36_12600 [bacterium (Candidatus Blackallbacteria) CG17_big_fil_post_rev_8_21_14_2_50_48_46]PIW46109.1 MAG: hypothetical protein COW20_17865 [bacterium (Candidatus Blackallbacteria) CG13_big_fil_rev_8_21_14_2_50_49_14]